MRIYNIPIFVPHKGCPFDCVFCNQKRITGRLAPVTADDVRGIIETQLKTINRQNAYIEAAFFGGSFTGIPIDEQTELLRAANKYISSGEIDGIRLSTRPDYINREILDNLNKYGVTTIELGVQSMDNEVLLASGRGHTAEQVEDAVELIRDYDFTLGLQMMTGLPKDTNEKSIHTAEKIIGLRPDIVRIYPTLVIEDTHLADLYRAKKYAPQSVEDAAMLCKTLLQMFRRNNIHVIRLGLQSTEEICENGSVVAGPVHSAFGEIVESLIYRDMILDAVNGHKGEITAFVNPKEVSKAVGNRKMNIIWFKNERNITLTVKADNSIKAMEVKCVCC